MIFSSQMCVYVLGSTQRHFSALAERAIENKMRKNNETQHKFSNPIKSLTPFFLVALNKSLWQFVVTRHTYANRYGNVCTCFGMDAVCDYGSDAFIENVMFFYLWKLLNCSSRNFTHCVCFHSQKFILNHHPTPQKNLTLHFDIWHSVASSKNGCKKTNNFKTSRIVRVHIWVVSTLIHVFSSDLRTFQWRHARHAILASSDRLGWIFVLIDGII